MRNFKNWYKNKKCKISPPRLNEKFEKRDGSYCVSNIAYIQDYLYYVKNEAVADNSPTRIYVNKIKNKITFEVKTGHHF